jgi:hypothetical protein
MKYVPYTRNVGLRKNGREGSFVTGANLLRTISKRFPSTESGSGGREKFQHNSSRRAKETDPMIP